MPRQQQQPGAKEGRHDQHQFGKARWSCLLRGYPEDCRNKFFGVVYSCRSLLFIIHNRNQLVCRASWARAGGDWPSYHDSRHWCGHPFCPPHSLPTSSPLHRTISPSRRCWHRVKCLSTAGHYSEGNRIAYPPRCVRRIPKHLFARLTGATSAEDRSGPAYDLDGRQESRIWAQVKAEEHTASSTAMMKPSVGPTTLTWHGFWSLRGASVSDTY